MFLYGQIKAETRISITTDSWDRRVHNHSVNVYICGVLSRQGQSPCTIVERHEGLIINDLICRLSFHVKRVNDVIFCAYRRKA